MIFFIFCFLFSASICAADEIKLKADNPKKHIPIIKTIAGMGFGYSGDGGPAKNAGLGQIIGICSDSSGSIYISDFDNCRIRKIDAHGIIRTIAGNGKCGASGPGQTNPAIWVPLNNPCALTTDGQNNLYFSDARNYLVRKVDTNDLISTVAGCGVSGYSGDGGPATQSKVNWVSGIAVDQNGDIYISDSYNNRIRKIEQNGIITTVCGDGTAGFSGDGGPAINAEVNLPAKMVFDSSGDLLFVDYQNHRIRKIDQDGTITTVAGTGVTEYSGDDGLATMAAMSPINLATDRFGNFYIQDEYKYNVRKVDVDGLITVVAGKNGLQGDMNDGVPAISAAMWPPAGITVDRWGNLYIADDGYFRVREVDMVVHDKFLEPGIKNENASLQNAVSEILTNDANDSMSSAEKILITEGNTRIADELAERFLNGEPHFSYQYWNVLSTLGGEKSFEAHVKFIENYKDGVGQRNTIIAGLDKFADKKYEKQKKQVLQDLFLSGVRDDALDGYYGLTPFWNRSSAFRKFVFAHVLLRPDVFGFGQAFDLIAAGVETQTKGDGGSSFYGPISMNLRSNYANYLQLLYKTLNNKDDEIRINAANLLSDVGNKDSLNELNQYVEDENLGMRLAIWNAVIKISSVFNIEPELPRDEKSLNRNFPDDLL